MSKLLPAKIRFFRKQLDMTQEELAEKCNVSPSCISRWETGRWAPNTHNLILLSQSLHVPLSELYYLEEEKEGDAIIAQISEALKSLSQKDRQFVLRMIIELKELHDPQ